MQAVQVIGIFLAGLIGVAAFTAAVAPGSTFGGGVSALGGAVAQDVAAAKH